MVVAVSQGIDSKSDYIVTAIVSAVDVNSTPHVKQGLRS